MKRELNITKWKRISFVFALILVEAVYSFAQTPASANQVKHVYVLVEAHGSQLAYKVEGKAVADPLRALERLWENVPKNTIVDIMIDPHATFLQLGEVEGLVGKAGFEHFNSFVYSQQSGQREPIRRGSSEAFRANP